MPTGKMVGIFFLTNDGGDFGDGIFGYYFGNTITIVFYRHGCEPIYCVNEKSRLDNCTVFVFQLNLFCTGNLD